jgi:hypothetical protein
VDRNRRQAAVDRNRRQAAVDRNRRQAAVDRNRRQVAVDRNRRQALVNALTIFGFIKMRKISLLTENLLVPQEGICSMELGT